MNHPIDTDAYIAAEVARRCAGPYTVEELRFCLDRVTDQLRGPLVCDAINAGDDLQAMYVIRALMSPCRADYHESEIIRELSK